MRYLIDTHVLIWWLGAPQHLSDRALTTLNDPSADVYVSAVSAWEIALKERLGKLTFDRPFLAEFDANVQKLSFRPLHLTAAHMILGAQFAAAHKDPFDRMLAGQVAVEQMAIMTADPAFATLGVQTVW